MSWAPRDPVRDVDLYSAVRYRSHPGPSLSRIQNEPIYASDLVTTVLGVMRIWQVISYQCLWLRSGLF